MKIPQKKVMVAVGAILLIGTTIGAIFLKKKQTQNAEPSYKYVDAEALAKEIDSKEDINTSKSEADDKNLNDFEPDKDGDIFAPSLVGKKSLDEIAQQVRIYVRGNGATMYKALSEDEFTKEEFKDCLVYTYFVDDDILAGPNETIDMVDENDPLLAQVQQMVAENGEADSALYFKDMLTGIGYEIVVSTDNYLDAYREVNGEMSLEEFSMVFGIRGPEDNG